MKSNFDVLVIGAGIAGMTAALYLKRANVSVAIIEDTAPGGQLNKVNKIDNYPGVINTDGPTLAFNVFSQILELNIPYIYGNVLKITNSNSLKIVSTNKGEFECKAVVVASGRKPIETGLEIEKKLIGNGISYCAICDGVLYKDKVVAVYTNNDHGIEEAKYLSNVCSKVYVVGIKKENFGNIEFFDSKITEINDFEGKINNIKLNDITLEISCLFVILGSYPSTNFIEVKKTNDYIVVDSNMNTSEEGIFACGDVIYKDLYQVSTAVGDGARAANSAIKYLNYGDK